jgi:hypothetical protein
MNYITGQTEYYLMQMRFCICIVMTYGHQWVTTSKTSKRLPKIKKHQRQLSVRDMKEKAMFSMKIQQQNVTS